ncbi:LOW QUALITY PROTEIN: Gag protein [Phytophthora palmivora]|uniref:Gag protein n=1 Tax=Phytophthora palmivora TaxID=4796 RepID=A0A2P4YNC1_9STRA|nr:LOW QUALITY PROTEIN: Gag protein [Phytophthora palmivora]
MRVLAASLVGNPLPEHSTVTVFMNGLEVCPFRMQLFCVHANTMKGAIQIALREEYSYRQTRILTVTGPQCVNSRGAEIPSNRKMLELM